MAATAVGPLIIGVAHDGGASYSTILRSIAATTAVVGAISSMGLRTPQRRPAPPSMSTGKELSGSDSVQSAYARHRHGDASHSSTYSGRGRAVLV